MLGMDGKWRPAEEPLHWLVDSPDPVHSGDPKTRAERSAQTHKTRTQGAGLGLPFAVAMVEATGVPIGLVACAHGGTSMEQWNPAKKDEGGNSLYGSMLRQVKLAGGKVKGVLWYQGESDANRRGLEGLPQGLLRLHRRGPLRLRPARAAVLLRPDRPVRPRAAIPRAGTPCRTPSDGSRTASPTRPSSRSIDLELDDGIHVGTQGLKRAGQRLARIAERELFGQVGATTPTFDRVTKGPTTRWSSSSKGSTWARRPVRGTAGDDRA